MSVQAGENQADRFQKHVPYHPWEPPEDPDPEVLELCARTTGHASPGKSTYLAALTLKEALQGIVDDYPGAAGYVMGYCDDSQLYDSRIESFPKERWALLGKVARDLFTDGLDTRNWSRFTQITARRAYEIAGGERYCPQFGVSLGQVFNLAVETHFPESSHPVKLYQWGRWIENMLAGFITIKDLDPPEQRRRMDAVCRPLARRNLGKIVSAVIAEKAGRPAVEEAGLEHESPRSWFGTANELARKRAWEGTELEDQDLHELIREAAAHTKEGDVGTGASEESQGRKIQPDRRPRMRPSTQVIESSPLEQSTQENGVPISEVVRRLIDDAYEDVMQERRKQEIERLTGLNAEEPPHPDILSRELEPAHEPSGLHYAVM